MSPSREGNPSTVPTERTPLLNNVTQETQLTVPSNTTTSRENTINNDPHSRAPIRQIAPDLLRGLLMIFMAEDHVNAGAKGYPHGTGLGSEDSTKKIKGFTNTLGYTMRTISHLCAPGFTMLLGMGLAFFIASRNGKGWKPIQYFKHIIFRTFGIIIGNYIALVFILFQGFWLPNVVLIALAFDYLVVGLLAIGLLFYIEPLLERLWSTILKENPSQSQSSSEEEETSPPPHLKPSSSRSKKAAFHTANLLLFILSAYTLFLTIQFDPKHGDCKQKSNTIMNFEEDGKFQFGQIYNLLSLNAPKNPNWLIERNCSNDKSKLIFNFLFYPIVCKGILSVFPPMAWLPMAIFGFLYGRLLLSRKKKVQKVSQTIQDTLLDVSLETFFAVMFGILFVFTRLFHFGNLSENCLPSSSKNKKSNPYLLSIKAFLYIVKYPPSPSFAFLTLSINFLLLVGFALSSSYVVSPKRLVDWLRSDHNPLLVFGRQSLFFYVIHLLISSIVAPILFSTKLVHTIPKEEWDGETEVIGIGLGITFFVYYALLICIMYPLCKAYAKFKSRQSIDSIWRFF